MEKVTAIILAGGKGTRMNSVDRNKVALHVNGEPMILKTIKILKEAGIKRLIVVVGFAKDSVIEVLPNDVLIAEQPEQLGTGDAVKCGLLKIGDDTKDVLIINGDDSFLHSPLTFRQLYKTHRQNNSSLTLITVELEDPAGLGRILRSEEKVVGIVEEKNTNEVQKKIKEVNIGCYLVDKKCLEENITLINKNKITGEYYATDLVDILAKKNEKISAFKLKDGVWKGVNTHKDLEDAEMIFAKK